MRYVLNEKGQEFVAAYRADLIANYPWASDEAKLDRFMLAVVETLLRGPHLGWNPKGDSVDRVSSSLGLRRKPSLKLLRSSLTDEVDGN